MACVLLVANYSNLASLYRDILSEEGHLVLVTSNAEEAYEIANTRKIDLAVMDDWLPQGAGEDLLNHLKNIQPHIIGILCPLNEFNEKAYRDLCDEGFLKSSDYTILQRKINRLSKKISNHGQGRF